MLLTKFFVITSHYYTWTKIDIDGSPVWSFITGLMGKKGKNKNLYIIIVY